MSLKVNSRPCDFSNHHALEEPQLEVATSTKLPSGAPSHGTRNLSRQPAAAVGTNVREDGTQCGCDEVARPQVA